MSTINVDNSKENSDWIRLVSKAKKKSKEAKLEKLRKSVDELLESLK